MFHWGSQAKPLFVTGIMWVTHIPKYNKDEKQCNFCVYTRAPQAGPLPVLSRVIAPISRVITPVIHV